MPQSEVCWKIRILPNAAFVYRLVINLKPCCYHSESSQYLRKCVGFNPKPFGEACPSYELSCLGSVHGRFICDVNSGL